jgi:hypothetical protein
MIDSALIGVEFVVVAIVCALLLRFYQSPLVTPDVSFTVYLSWVLGFAAVLILPYDLSIAVVHQFQSPILEQLWAFVYWRFVMRHSISVSFFFFLLFLVHFSWLGDYAPFKWNIIIQVIFILKKR